MNSVLWKVADAVRASLATLSGLPSAPILSAPDLEVPLDQLGTTRIDVTPFERHELSAEQASDLTTRHDLLSIVTVAVVVRRRFAGDDVEGATIKVAAIDNQCALLERLNAHLATTRRLGVDSEYAWLDGGIVQAYSLKHLHQMRQFTGRLQVRYEVHRAL